jgi:hypothetical protein
MASADSEVRPGPSADLTPVATQTTEAGPKLYPHPPCRFGPAGRKSFECPNATQIGQFWTVRVEGGATLRCTPSPSVRRPWPTGDLGVGHALGR